MPRIALIILLGVLTNAVGAQAPTYQIKSEDQPLHELLKEVAEKYGLKFSYDPRLLSEHNFTGDITAGSPKKLIEELIAQLPLRLKKAGNVYLIIPDKGKQIVKGTIFGEDSGQPLAFAHLQIDQATAAISNSNGAFEIVPSRDSLQITIRHIGYKPRTVKIGPGLEDLSIKLQPDETVLPDFILDGSQKFGRSHALSEFSVNPAQINSLPTLGEADLFKSLQLLPGIQAADESSSGLIVRGGSPEQNLVLMDGFTIYHLDHFFGLFSIFNPNTINHVDIYKGGFGAKYGGRISSVVNARGKGAELSTLNGGLGASMTSVNGYAGVPIGKNISWLVGARRSQNFLADVIYNQFLDDNRVDILQSLEPDFRNDEIDIDPTFGFYDISSKLRWQINKNSQVDFNIYLSEDEYTGVFEEQDDFSSFIYNDEATWSNVGTSLVWSQQFNPGHHSTVTVSTSGYESFSNTHQEISYVESFFEDLDSLDGEVDGEVVELFKDTTFISFGLDKANSIIDFTANWENDLELNDENSLIFGAGLSAYETDYTLTFVEDEDEYPEEFFEEAILTSAFIEYEYNPAKWQLNLGVRYNNYDLLEREDLEPRINIKYLFNDNLTLKGGWTRHNQYLNRITVSPFGNSDQYYWTLANGPELPVLSSEHLIFGLEYQLENWTFDIETYRKKSSGITESEFILYQQDLEVEGESDLTGDNFSRGLDLFTKYRTDRFTSWVSYSLGFSENKIAALKDNSRYWSTYDQRHEVNLVNMIKVGKWEFSSVFIYASGRPYTPPGQFDEDRSIFFDVDRINELRLPAYHRLDLAAKYTVPFGKSRLETGLTLFNLYNRRNVKARRFTAVFEFDEFSNDGEFVVRPVDIQLLGLTPNLFVNIHF